MMMARGFTLLEVLVAVVIIAVLAAAVGVGLSGLGGSRQLQREATRLQQHVQYACQMAQLDGYALGLRLRPGSYAFVRRDGPRWRVLDQVPAMAQHVLATGVRVSLKRDGRHVAVPMAAGSAAQTQAPQLVCFASGDLTPFHAQLTRTGADERFSLVGYADGHVSLEAHDVPR